MTWNASHARSFEKDLFRLPDELREQAAKLIRRILENPWIGKKLKGRRNRFAVRITRDYRIVYSVYKTESLIDFEFAGDRKEAYRWFRHE